MELMSLNKLILITVLGMVVVSCSLFSPSRWAEYEKDRAGSGRKCYRNSYGNIFCEDGNGNRY